MRKIWLGMLVITSLSFASCKSKTEAPVAPPEYKVKTIDTTTAVVYAEYSAVLQSEAVVEIRPKVSGYLAEISVNEGQWVKKGTQIFKIEDADYIQKVNSAKAGMQSAKASRDNALLEVKKLTPLVEKGIISPFELETKKGNLEAAEAALLQAEAAYEDAKINLGYTSILAPTSGVLSRIDVRVGSLVSPSGTAPLTTISGDGDVFAYFSFDEKNLAPLRRARFNSGEYNPAGKENIELLLADGQEYGHKGKLESASGIIDRTTGSIQLKVVFPNPDKEILSGSSGVVKIPATYKGCITIPQNATYELQDKIMVFVVGQNNEVTRKIITIEGTSGKNYVVSGGLERGDRIVTEGADKLKDGMIITPKE